MPTDFDISEAERFLAKHPEIATIEVLIPDASGILRGKRIGRVFLPKIFKEGLRLPGAIYALDAAGDTIVESGLSWDEGEADRPCYPVAGTLQPVPWSKRPLGQILVSMRDLDGTPFYGDPRTALAEVLARYRGEGLAPGLAVELEFYLLDRERDQNGRPQPPRSPLTGRRAHMTQVLSLTDLGDFEDFFGAVEDAATAQGLPLEAAVSEAAPGQFEVNLHYSKDAMLALDQGILLKRLIRGVAERLGYEATFMAKPYPTQPGNGLHLHMSLYDGKGRNVFDDGTEAGTPTMRAAVAGMMASMAECMAAFAPNANSYRRFQESTYAPVSPLWSYNNRTTALRIPASANEARRIEHRVAGADANIHLTAAVVLAGAHRGLAGKLDPGPASVGNAYAQAGATRLPRIWSDALRAFETSSFVREYLGERFQRLYAACRWAERRTFEAQISSIEYEWYLRQI